MITLVPMCTMTMRIDRAVNAGPGPTGQRMVAGISGVAVLRRVAGEMLGGGNADWFTMTADGLMLPDVRLAIQTHDEAIVLVRYSGRMRFARGQESVAFVAAVFETGDPRYQWINSIQAAGKGILSADLLTGNTSSSSSRRAGHHSPETGAANTHCPYPWHRVRSTTSLTPSGCATAFTETPARWPGFSDLGASELRALRY